MWRLWKGRCNSDQWNLFICRNIQWVKCVTFSRNINFTHEHFCYISIRFDLDNVTGKVKVRFSHVPDGFLVQTDQVNAKIKHEKGTVKLYDRTSTRRILSMHISDISNFFQWISILYLLISDDYGVNNIVNDNFNDINMFAVIEKVLDHQLLDTFNKVFSQFSYSQLFPL